MLHFYIWHDLQSPPNQAHSLSNIKLGYPLWQPEPHTSGEVQIGDIGYIDGDGAFVRLFNVRTGDPQYSSKYEVVFWKDSSAKDMESLSVHDVLLATASNPVAPMRKYLSRGIKGTVVKASAQSSVYVHSLKER